MHIAMHVAAVIVTIGCAGSGFAQILPSSMVKAMDAEAMKAVGPAVQAVLADGTPGAFRPWTSSEGHGFARLIGPDKKQPACNRVRMNSVVEGVEKRGYIFIYCRDPAGHWRVAG